MLEMMAEVSIQLPRERNSDQAGRHKGQRKH